MSARDLLLPDRALMGVLTSLNNRLVAAERRMRFPGAVRFISGDGPISQALSPAFTTITQLTLDHGRWVILAGGYSENALAGGAYILVWQLSENVGGTLLTARNNESGGFATSYDTFCMAWTVSVKTSVTVTLSGSRSSGLTSALARNFYIIAIPA